MNLNNNELKKSYDDTLRESIIKAHKFAVKKHKHNGNGQRTISYEIKKKFDIEISENTISGWIHKNLIPFANEKTQFKCKPTPPKKILERLYVVKKQSASKIAEKFKVSTIIVINWLREYNLEVRSHIQSMNTLSVKQELRKLKLKYPTKEYKKLTPAKSYILGVLCGDGYIDKKSIKLEIRNDQEFITAFSNSIKMVYGLDYNWIYYEKRKTLLLAISSMIMAKDLLRYGNFRTWTWVVPEEISITKDNEIIASFIRGIYDSEGSVGNYNINFTTASSNGAHQLRLLLHKLDIESKMIAIKGKYHLIIISRKKNIKLFDKLIGFTISRKRVKLYSMYKLGWDK